MSKSDVIAYTVLNEFEQLAANRKPAVRTNGIREWVPLSGIVAEHNGKFTCLALATGMKCLPTSKVRFANGVGIHDWHAEILALRAFNRFVLQECHNILTRKEPSEYIAARWATGEHISEISQRSQPFSWRDAVHLHMYCSEAPCGDASMELTMAAQDDASPWAVLATGTGKRTDETLTSESMLSGRGYFSQLGMVRRKPGRGDSPLTLSKSCSDKLALRQCMSILSGLSSLLVAPSPGLYLQSIVLPASQHSESGCQRCFSAHRQLGRMQPVAGRSWPGGYAFMPFDIHTTSLEFSFSKRSLAGAAHSVSSSLASSNLSVVWTCHGVNECLVGGVLRGRKAFDLAGASSVSRRRMWQLVKKIATLLLAQEPQEHADCAEMSRLTCCLRKLIHIETYDSVKSDMLLVSRSRVKEEVKDVALRGWVPNDRDGNWMLDT